MPLPRPLVALDRASGSVNDICPSGSLQNRLKALERRHLLAQRCDLVLQPKGFGLRHLAFLPVRRLQRRQVSLDTGRDLIDALLQLGAGEVLVPSIHRLELAAVDRRHRMGEEDSGRRHSAMNCRHVARIAGPLSLNSAMVLKSATAG